MKIKSFSKHNVIFAIFFSTLFLSYMYLRFIGYIFYLIACVILIYDLFLNKHTKSKAIFNTSIFYLFLFFCIYSILISIINTLNGNSDIGSIIKLVSSYVIFLFLYYKLKIYGTKYILTFYRLFMITTNFFACLNIYEIITKTSMFSKFLTTDLKDFQAVFYGTQYFRTTSIFMHPILYGLFLTVLFWCNKYLIKSKWKYLLQLNVIINLYYTKSRSAWLAFAIILVVYYLKFILTQSQHKKIRLTNKRMFIISFACIFIFISSIYFKNNIVNVIDSITNRFISVLDDSYGDGSRLQRLGAINVIYQGMKKECPLTFLCGNGINSSRAFMQHNTILISGFTSADNQYATFFYEFGLIGLLTFIAINVVAFIKFIKSKKIDDISNLSILCLLSIAIDIFFFDGFRWTSVAIFLVAIITFVCANKLERGEQI